jgi:hypothetical protein
VRRVDVLKLSIRLSYFTVPNNILFPQSIGVLLHHRLIALPIIILLLLPAHSLSAVITSFPWIVHLHQLQRFVFTARAFCEVYAIMFYHAQWQRYFYQSFMQRQFHFFEHFIYSLVAVSVCQDTFLFW